MTTTQSLESGLIGALTLTAIHETARHQIPDAPRMDVFASRAIVRSMKAFDQKPLPNEQLYPAAMTADIVSNTLFYSLVGLGKPETAPARGAVLGLAAGVAAVVLPPSMGLGQAPSSRTGATEAMTVAWYFFGGLTAGIAYRLLAKRRESEPTPTAAKSRPENASRFAVPSPS